MLMSTQITGSVVQGVSLLRWVSNQVVQNKTIDREYDKTAISGAMVNRDESSPHDAANSCLSGVSPRKILANNIARLKGI